LETPPSESCIIPDPWQDGSKDYPEREPPPLDPEIIDGEEHYHVEAFLARRINRGTIEENEFISETQLREDMSPDEFQRVLDAFLAKQNRSGGGLPAAAAHGQRRSSRQHPQRNA